MAVIHKSDYSQVEVVTSNVEHLPEDFGMFDSNDYYMIYVDLFRSTAGVTKWRPAGSFYMDRDKISTKRK